MVNNLLFTTVLLIVYIATSQTALVSTTSYRFGTSNRYFIYTPYNARHGIEVQPNDNSIKENTKYDPTLQTIVIVHGGGGSYDTTLNPTIKDEILKTEKVNIIIVDWSLYAGMPYASAVAAVPSVGNYLSQFIMTLNTLGTKYEEMHLIGFDLGAHVVGFAGRYLDGKIGKITGLDPAGEQWSTNGRHLTKTDALFVEIIHTDTIARNALGIGIASGHLDFFINGGALQPGCRDNACSHNRAYEIMAASFNNVIVGKLCNTMAQVTSNSCIGWEARVGNNDVQKIGSGIYRANTGNTYPFN